MSTYEEEILAWRQNMDVSLRAENSWLALAGLFWLKPGRNTFGSAQDNDIVIAVENVPPHAGVFIHQDRETRLETTGEGLTVDGEPISLTLLADTEDGELVTFGDLAMLLLKRGDKFAIRLWDNQRPNRSTFPGRVWYDVDPTYCLTAGFSPYTEAQMIQVPDAVGMDHELPAIGSIQFQIEGTQFQLEALEGPPGASFLIFKDQTSGDGSYTLGRYLVTGEIEGSEVEVDFNRAYNPPCAFTSFATCPLTPETNDLPVSIPAGERYQPLST